MSIIELPESFEALPSSVEKIQKLFRDETLESETLIHLLQQDPLLCANILKLINSPYYGMSHKITSIEHALMLLGPTIVRGIIMATLLKKSFGVDLRPYGITLDTFDKICILRSRVLSLWMKDSDFDITMLSSAAFLMESGKIVLAHEIIRSEYLDAFSSELLDAPTESVESKYFAISSYELTAKLFDAWLFSSDFVSLIEGVTEPQREEQKILHLLWILINTKEILSESSKESALLYAQEFGFDTKKLTNAIERVAEEFSL